MRSNGTLISLSLSSDLPALRAGVWPGTTLDQGEEERDQVKKGVPTSSAMMAMHTAGVTF